MGTRQKDLFTSYQRLIDRYPRLHAIMTKGDFIKEIKLDPGRSAILIDQLNVALDELSNLSLSVIKKYWEIAYEVITVYLFLSREYKCSNIFAELLQYYRDFIKEVNKSFPLRNFELEVITYYAGHTVLLPSIYGRPGQSSKACKNLFDTYFRLIPNNYKTTKNLADFFCKTVGGELYKETDQARVLKLYEYFP